MRIREAVEMIGAAGLNSDGPGIWADLGCGDGTFTRALAHLLAPGSVIHAVDTDAAALTALANITAGRDDWRDARNSVAIVTHRADFTQQPWPFDGPLSGILLANSLHYVRARDQEAFVRTCAARLNVDGRFIVVEYDHERPNTWVPYPVSRRRLTTLFAAAGYSSPVWLGSRPSMYQSGGLYAALISRLDPTGPKNPTDPTDPAGRPAQR